MSPVDDRVMWRSQGSCLPLPESQQLVIVLDCSAERGMLSWLGKATHPSNIELMKDRFAKLLLGEVCQVVEKEFHLLCPCPMPSPILQEYIDNFRYQNEYWYVKQDDDDSETGSAPKEDDKSWLPTVKVPPSGLSEVSRKWLQYQKELVNQVLKAAMAINANVLMEMEVSEAYIESLPKNGRESLGDALYQSIIFDFFFYPKEFLASNRAHDP